jgi:2-polyprenyl-3-methyl-5-hydroxy-6-metoxy-1,4-benzoquinol methylase
MFRPIRTYSDAWLSRHRETHAVHSLFGTHRHPYLLDTMRRLGSMLAAEIGEKPSLLDYGCGKGVFLRDIAAMGLFRFIRGFDPAVEALKVRPSQAYDMVTCLDVLDQLEAEYVEAVIRDVAQFTGRVALFDVITVQVPSLAHLNPRSAAEWQEIIGRHMELTETILRPATEEELRQGACPERVIILAVPHGA